MHCRELVISLAKATFRIPRKAMTGHDDTAHADPEHSETLFGTPATTGPELSRGSLFGRYVVLREEVRGSRVTKLVLHQGGNDQTAEKVE